MEGVENGRRPLRRLKASENLEIEEQEARKRELEEEKRVSSLVGKPHSDLTEREKAELEAYRCASDYKSCIDCELDSDEDVNCDDGVDGTSNGTKTKKGRKVEGGSGEYKYPMSQGAGFMEEMARLAEKEAEEPPEYATQGESIGKKRGRKPAAKAKAKGKPAKAKRVGKQRKSKKGQPGKQSKSKNKQKAPKRVREPNVKARARKAPRVEDEREEAPPARRTRRKKQDDGNGASSSAGNRPVHHGELRTPPAHVGTNHIYSSAYRRNQGQGVAFAKMAGQMATALYAKCGQVDDLCGSFRSAPRSK